MSIPYKKTSSEKLQKQALWFPASLKIVEKSEIIIEIGPGRGDFLFFLAKSHPDKIIVAIEIKQKRVDKLIDRIQVQKLDNIIVIDSDARLALKNEFSLNSIEAIHINFPDPWPKRKHSKNRVIHTDFIETCISKLKSRGLLYFNTDVAWYANKVAKLMTQFPQLKSCFTPTIKNNSAESFETLFYEKWKRMGRSFYYQKYKKSDHRQMTKHKHCCFLI